MPLWLKYVFAAAILLSWGIGLTFRLVMALADVVILAIRFGEWLRYRGKPPPCPLTPLDRIAVAKTMTADMTLVALVYHRDWVEQFFRHWLEMP